MSTWDHVKGGSVGDKEGASVGGLGGIGGVACGHTLVLDCGDCWDSVAFSTGSLSVNRDIGTDFWLYRGKGNVVVCNQDAVQFPKYGLITLDGSSIVSEPEMQLARGPRSAC